MLGSKSSFSPYVSQGLFILVLILIVIFYDYFSIVFKRPQSIHKWRQSDCASMALNYHQHDISFFQPQTHNLTADKGTTGKQATSEVPLLYYVVGKLYDVFGHYDAIYRGLNTLIFLIGIFYLFKFSRLILYDDYWAGLIALLVLCSPVLVYYGSNFLTNSTALSFVFVGWYHFAVYQQNRTNKALLWSLFFFGLAGALKLPAFMSLFAIGLYWFIETLFPAVTNKKETKLFSSIWKFPLLFVLVLAPAIVWALYARQYNTLHDTTYFSTTTFPIWEMSFANVIELIKDVKERWSREYFPYLLYTPLFIVFVIFSILNRQFPLFQRVVLWTILVQIIAFVCLQYGTFAHHDYYTINLFIFPVLNTLFCLNWLKKRYQVLFQSVALKIAVGLFMAVQVYYTAGRLQLRYQWPDEHGTIHEITHYLRSIGLTPKDKVVFVPDMSHASLYLINQPGWTEYVDARFDREEPIPYNNSAEAIQLSITKGAKYLILNSLGELYKKSYLKQFCYHLIGTQDGVLVFDLNSQQRNFDLASLTCVYHLKTNLEVLSEDSLYVFTNNEEPVKLIGKRSTTESRSGKQSVVVNKESPFALETYTPVLKEGQTVVATLWRKSTITNGELVASAEGVYKSSREVRVKDELGWEQLRLTVFVDKQLKGRQLKFYGLNVGEQVTYFDDLEIRILNYPKL